MTFAKQIAEVKRAIRRLEFCLEYVVTGRYDAAIGKRKKISNRTDIRALIAKYDNKPPRPKSSKGDSFQRSAAWKALREHFLSLCDRICMKCGSTDDINVDHIKPKSKYPALALDINNLQVLCWGCNKAKSNVDETDYRKVHHV